MSINNILNLLREMDETDPVDSKEVYQFIKENGLLMMTDSFKKQCVGMIDAKSLKEQDYDMWRLMSQLDGVDNDSDEKIEEYLYKKSGIVLIQLIDDGLDIYSPPKEYVSKYKEICNPNEKLKEKTKHLNNITFRSKGDDIVPMVDLEELKTLGFRIKKNGLSTSWGIQHPDKNNHHYGSYVAIETNKEDTHLIAKDSKGLPSNYEKI